MEDRVIIIGASHAAAQLSASLRQEGWEGEILVIGNENHLPYHRPPLSKAFLSGEKNEAEILIRPEIFYEKNQVTFQLGVNVESINRAEKKLTLSTGETLAYSKLALCLGSRARQVPIPGSELSGVHYLRTLDDVEAIKQDVHKGKHAVIVGGGYIGLETAAVLNTMGMHVTVLEMMDRVLQRVTAPELSEFYTRIHTEEGVTIKTGAAVSEIVGEERVESINCADGSNYPAELVIIGAGIVPNVELAEAAGLATDNGILVDEFAQTADPDIVAAGDCTNHPNGRLGRNIRLESVPNATEQAKAAAASLCGKQKAYSSFPWFWSDQYDLKLQIAGLNQGYDQIVIRGDHQQGRSFVAWYLRDGQLLAADCVNRAIEFAAAKQLLDKEISVSPEDLADESINPMTWIKG